MGARPVVGSGSIAGAHCFLTFDMKTDEWMTSVKLDSLRLQRIHTTNWRRFIPPPTRRTAEPQFRTCAELEPRLVVEHAA
jgi:hypothetical protein